MVGFADVVVFLSPAPLTFGKLRPETLSPVGPTLRVKRELVAGGAWFKHRLSHAVCNGARKGGQRAEFCPTHAGHHHARCANQPPWLVFALW